jgi:hypothetical protein
VVSYLFVRNFAYLNFKSFEFCYILEKRESSSFLLRWRFLISLMAEFNNVLKTIIDFVSFFYVFFYDSNLIYQFFANLFCLSNNDLLIIMLMKIVTKLTIVTLVIIATGVFIAIENNIISTTTTTTSAFVFK